MALALVGQLRVVSLGPAEKVCRCQPNPGTPRRFPGLTPPAKCREAPARLARCDRTPASTRRRVSGGSRCMDRGARSAMPPAGWERHSRLEPALTKSNWQDAAEALHATNNFPELPGWLCPAPCERACVLAIECELVGHRRWLCRHRTAGVARRSRGRSQVATAHRFRRRRLRHDGRRRVCLWRHDTGSKPRRGAIADGRACAAAVDATLEGDTDRHPRGRSLRRNPERGH